MDAIEKDPGAGDPFAIRMAGWSRQFKAVDLRGSVTSVESAVTAASGDAWTGQAQMAFAAHVAEAVPELTELADSLDATGAALATYADAVQTIQDKQVVLESSRARLAGERYELERLLRVADAEGYSSGPADPHDAAYVERLRDKVATKDTELADIEVDWDNLVRDRRRADGDLITALRSRDVRGALAGLGGTRTRDTGELLLLLSGLSATDMKILLATNPDLLDRLHQANPEEVAEWWAGMNTPGSSEPSPQQNLLIENLPAFIGALGGLPASARVAANRVVAIQRLAKLREQMKKMQTDGPPATPTTSYGTEEVTPAGRAVWQNQIDALQLALDYLERVEDGDVMLYLYDPDREQIIEMFGNPDTAKSILSFMPGTNTTVESFYRTDEYRITEFAEWQVNNAKGGGSVAGFVVKQGDFPQLGGNMFATGPQNNDMAESLGRAYAGFAKELKVITGGAPVVSVEHSFGSAVGGEAETRGAGFDTRVSLAGIGMGWGWQADPDTDHIAMQAPNDVNRHLDGAQAWNWGYAHKPDASSGFTELGSGIPGTPGWVPIVAPLALPVALVGDVVSGVEHHNQIISGDSTRNSTVLTQVQIVMENAGAKAG